MSEFGKVIQNTLVQGLGRLGSVGVSIVLTGLLYRAFGQTGFGAYSFISAFVLLFGHISDWGTNIITVREASRSAEKRPVIFGTIFILRFVLALVSFLAVNLVIRANPSWHDLVPPTTVASLVLVFLSFKTSSQMVFQTLTRLELSAIVDFIASIAFLALAAASIYLYRDNLNSLMFAWFLATLTSGLFGLIIAIKLTTIKWTYEKDIAIKIFKQAVPTGALLITFSLYNRIDIVILQALKGSSEVAPYALAYKIFDNSILGAAFLMNALFPHLAREFTNSSKEALKNYFQKAFDILLISGLALFLFLLIFSPLIIQLLSGETASPATPLLRVLGLGAYLAYFNHLNGFSLIAIGRQKTSLFIALSALILNCLANYLLIPSFSYFASAWLTVATEGFVLLISSIIVIRAIGFRPKLFSFPKTIAEIFNK